MKRFNKLTAWLLTLAMLMTFIPSYTLEVSAADATAKITGTPRRGFIPTTPKDAK